MLRGGGGRAWRALLSTQWAGRLLEKSAERVLAQTSAAGSQMRGGGRGESQAAAVGVYCEMRTRRVADELGHSVMNNTPSIAVSVASP